MANGIDMAAPANTLLEQGYADCAIILDAFSGLGRAATADDVRRHHEAWLAIPEDDRHLAALCFMQFDGNREVFEGVTPT